MNCNNKTKSKNIAMFKTIVCICVYFMLYHFRDAFLPEKIDNLQNKYLNKDSAFAESLQPNKLVPLPDSSRFKVTIKVSGLFNGEDSVSVR